MTTVLDNFLNIIKEYTIIQDREDHKIRENKIKIIFSDSTILEATEIEIFSLKKRKYAYHWMDSNFQLLIRWDNALHHKQISSFPHHKHISDEKNIFDSHDISLKEVLEVIASKIKPQSAPPYST